MYRTFYQQLSSTWLPTATMIFFVVMFIAALLRLFVFNRRENFDGVAALPLEKEQAP